MTSPNPRSIERTRPASYFVSIAVDVVYIALYIVKGLWITGALYLFFIALCIGGYRAWRAHLDGHASTAVEPGAPRPRRNHEPSTEPAR